MSKALKVVGTVAGVVATVAAFVPGGQAVALIAGGIAAATSIGASLLAKKPKAPEASPENLDRLNVSIDPRTPRKIAFGTTALATDIRDQEFTDDQTYYHRFLVVASHEVDEITEIWFDDQQAWTLAGGVQGDFVGYLEVAVRTEGSSANAINISARMGTTRRYTGLAYVHLKYKLTGASEDVDSPFAQSIPSRVTIRGNGALVYDPRLDPYPGFDVGPNLLSSTKDFSNATWTKTNATVTTDTTTAPDGTTTADKLVESTATGLHRVFDEPGTLTLDTRHSISIYAKAAGRNWIVVRATSEDNVNYRTWFNLSTGAIGTVSGDHDSLIEDVGSGWYRCSININSGATDSVVSRVYYAMGDADGSDSYTGDGTSGVYLWEAGANVGLKPHRVSELAHQDAYDQSTWIWDDDASNNPALQLLWYLLGWRITNPSTLEELLVVGKGVPPARIDLDSFATAANMCDESVALDAGGTEPRYRTAGVFSEGDSPTVVIDNLKASMNAELDDVDGKIRLSVLYDDLASPVASFTEDDVIGEFEWRQTRDLSETFNIVRGVWTDPSDESLYQQIDYPEVTLESPDGIDRIDTFNLPLVQSASQAQRLAKQRLQREQYAGRFKAVFQATAWKVQKGDPIELSFAPLGWVDKLFRVASIEYRVDGTVPLELIEEHEDIYAWDAEESAPVQPVAPTTYDFTKSPIYTSIADKNARGVVTAIRGAYYKPDGTSSVLVGKDNSGNGRITVNDFIAEFSNGYGTLSITGDDIDSPVGGGSLSLSSGATTVVYHVYFVDSTLADTTPTFLATTSKAAALQSDANPYNHYLGPVIMPESGGGDTGGGGGPGYGGGDPSDPLTSWD